MKKTFAWEPLFKKHVIFSGIKEEQLKPLIMLLLRDEVSSERKYTEGSVILEEGELGDSIFLIGLGSVQVTVRGKDDYEIILSVLKQGEFFGEMALLEEKPRAATVRARENCIVLEIKGEEFRHILNQYHAVESKILLKLSERLRSTNEQLLSVKQIGIDAQLDQLNAKLNEQARIVDSRLQTAQALFDQTKLRTDEVINSAERSRTRLTTTMSAVGAVVGIAVALFGWFGIQGFLNLREQATAVRSDIETYAEEAKKQANVAKKLVDETNESARALAVTVQKQENLHQESRQWLDQSKETLIRHILWPELFIAVSEGNQSDNAVPLYDSYKELRLFDDYGLVYLLDIIEGRFSDRSHIHNPPKYMELLPKIRQDISSVRDKTKAYYLYLANAILANLDEFEKTLPQFEDYVKKHPSVRINKRDVNKLENFFAADPEKHRLFQRLRPLIPTE